jgi:predicted ATPase/DNA-binding SARP family transcriptional activator
VRFRILGPLQVDVDGRPVAVGGPKPRTLLAVLLVRRGEIVSVDRLVDALWPRHSPDGAVSALRAYVSRLRAMLGGRITHQPPGYRIEVTDDELDAAEFEASLHAARTLAAGGDHPGALARLDTALALWRGEALAEFADLDFAAAEATRLAELRLAAVEDRIDALLHLGCDTEVVPEAEGLIHRFPARERPVVQLMRALYGAGRQSDALAAYHALRRRLDDELGVEPSEPASTLYRRILGHDASLTSARPRTNLSRRATSFVGRDAEVPLIVEALVGAPLVTLTGVGGVGKSRLAEEVASRTTSRFGDGVWLVELARLGTGGPVGHAVAGALRVQQRHGMTIEQSVIEYLRTRRLLLVLDNCEHVLDAASGLVEDVVAQCPEVTVLATSREPLGVAGEQRWTVGPLPEQDASALFVLRARTNRPDFRPDRESAGVIAEICRRLDGLPLGIELAAARMRAMSAAEIAQRLERPTLLHGGARGAPARQQSLEATIAWSYRLLSEPEQRLFGRLSVFAGGADLAGVHGVCADPSTTEDDTLDLLTRLVDKSMVTPAIGAGRSRYRMLETLRAYGRDALGSRARPWQRRHAAYFAGLAQRAAAGLQGADERAWVERVLPDYDNLRAAFDRATEDRDVDLVLRLVTSLPELVYLRVGYESAGWAERVLDLAPTDHPLFAAAAGAAARGAWADGDYPRARTLAARAGGQAPGRGTGRIAYPADVLADVALYEGDVDFALAHYEREVRLARHAVDPIRLVWTLYYVAVCHAVRREPELGVPAAQESVQVAETTANPTALSMARYALGLVLKKSEPERALALFDEAGELAASVGNLWWHGIAMMEAAATRAVHRDPETAAHAAVEVLDHWDRVGDWTQQWLNLRYVARLLVRLGADHEAVVLHHCLVAAGRPSPLDPARLPAVDPAPAMSWAAAVAYARACLARFS